MRTLPFLPPYHTRARRELCPTRGRAVIMPPSKIKQDLPAIMLPKTAPRREEAGMHGSERKILCLIEDSLDSFYFDTLLDAK